jgi:general secretion pathway protein E
VPPRRAADRAERALVASMGIEVPATLYAPVGCDACNHDRLPRAHRLYELLPVDETTRRLIHDGAGELALRDAARRAGQRSLRADGARWLASGLTSLAELVRVTREG